MKFFLILLFITKATAIFIECILGNYQFPPYGSTYSCEVLRLIHIDESSTTIHKRNGSHLNGHVDNDVRIISFEGQYVFDGYYKFNLTFIPKGFLNYFPNLIGLRFSFCPIDFLNGDELDEYPNLEHLMLSNTNLKHLPGNFFSSTPNMKYINFMWNQIEIVGEGLLDHLEALIEVNFMRNSCINQEAKNSSQIRNLMNNLRVSCSVATTTEPTTTQLTTTAFNPFRCFENSIENFVCSLNDEIKKQNSQILILENRIRHLEGFIVMQDQIQDLQEDFHEMKVNLELLKESFNEAENNRRCGAPTGISFGGSSMKINSMGNFMFVNFIGGLMRIFVNKSLI